MIRFVPFKKISNLCIYIFSLLLIISIDVSAQAISVQKFILLNADGNRKVPEWDPLPDGAVLDYALLPTSRLNVFARVSSDTLVQSVVFSFDGNSRFMVETKAPYTLFGDDNGRYKGLVMSVGWHTVTCTPFTGPNGTGTAGASLKIRFKIIDSRIQVPKIEIGQSQAISFPVNTANLKAIITDDCVPSDPVLTWEVISDKTGAVFSRTDSVLTTITFAQPGTYLIRALANDGAAVSHDSLFIVVRPQPEIPASLKTVPVPGPEMVPGFDFTQFVVNKEAAINLGKILFWDMQAGSDGIQACASCHYHAGADVRFKNQMSPGTAGIANKKFERNRGPNYTLIPSEFPFIKEDDDIVSSQGVFNTDFVDIFPGNYVDQGQLQADPFFSVTGIQTRKVQPRNTPSAINAVYTYKNNWDGGAQPIFNGATPGGFHDKIARVIENQGGNLVQVQVAIPYSSLASQAAGPVVSEVEMSFKGRPFPKIGKKLLSLKPLARQLVDPADSRLGVFSAFPQKGLKPEVTYEGLIKEAFNSKWWDSDKTITFSGTSITVTDHKENRTTNEYTLMEANFSLFWGLALQLYQATLRSDDSKFDKWREGTATLNDAENRGLNLFMGKARCIHCHAGPEFTNASVSQQRTGKLIDRMPTRDSSFALYDIGFYNIGLRHMAEDPGAEARDKYGTFLTYSRQINMSGTVTDTLTFDPNNFTIPGPVSKSEKIAVRGVFKVPTLRNVELNGPYFHNGAKATLLQVIDAYDVGGHFAGENWRQMTLDITELKLTLQEKNDLVAFLLTLTDERVRNQSAPFDHPQLFIPHGHTGNQLSVSDDGTGRAITEFVEIPAVGAGGGPPLKPFFEQQFKPGNPDDVVPVELTDFTGQYAENMVTLHWETATETNNKGFDIERRIDAGWERIGFVEGNGTTSEVSRYRFEDHPVSKSGKVYYRIKQIDYDGTFSYTQELVITLQAFKYALLQNYPNPFNPATAISFTVPEAGRVRLSIINSLGEEIAVLINDEVDAGYHSVELNGSNLSSGVYFYKLEAGKYTSIKKMLLLK